MGIHDARCRGCGSLLESDEPMPTPDHCGECPPWRCEDCGGMDSQANPCSCWVQLDGMPLADLKALFALGDLDLQPEGGDHA